MEQIIFSSIVTAAGFILIIVGIWLQYTANNILNWTTIKIEILDSKICSEQSSADQYNRYTWYYPAITYKYYINGTLYTNKTVSFDRKNILSSSEADAKKLLTDITKKSEAYYNPTKPFKAVLTKEISKQRLSHYRTLVVSGVLLVISGTFLIFIV